MSIPRCRPRARRPKPSCSYVTVTVTTNNRGQRGRATQGSSKVDFVLPGIGTKRSSFSHHHNNADPESSSAFFIRISPQAKSAYWRRSERSHYPVYSRSREYVPSGPAPTWKKSRKSRRKTHKHGDIPKRRSINDQSYGSMITEPRSIRERSRQRTHRKPSQSQQDLRYPLLSPPSHCSSSSGSKWIGRPPPDMGYVESGSLNSSRLPSPAPSIIRQASTTDALVKRQISPTKLVPDHHGLLASGGGNNTKRNLWLGMASESFDSCSETSSGYRLRLRGHLAARPCNTTSHLGPNPSSSSHNKGNDSQIISTGAFDRPARPKKGSTLSRDQETKSPSDIDHHTRPTKMGLVRRLCGTFQTVYRSVISLASHRGSRSKGRATSSELVHRSSEGFNGIDRGSNGSDGATDIPGQLPELDKNELLGTEQTGRSTWAREMIDEFSTCMGNHEPEWYAAARKELKLDE